MEDYIWLVGLMVIWSANYNPVQKSSVSEALIWILEKMPFRLKAIYSMELKLGLFYLSKC